MLRQLVIIGILSTVLGLGINLVSPNRIDYIGKYRVLQGGDKPVIPPDVDPGDPPFMALDLAELEYTRGEALFVDSREPEEFDCGTIPGSINVPFDYLPEGDLAPYFDSAFGGAPLDRLIITYCSGEECDLSLHLARNLQILGYTNVFIFYGGAREWENFGLGLEKRRDDCGEL